MITNKEYETDIYNNETVVAELKRNYDGYSFDRKCKSHVFNPWSIIKFLERPKEGFIPYWVSSGGSTPTFLVNYLKHGLKKYNADELQSLLQIDSTVDNVSSKLYPTIDNIAKIDLFAILYQAGYFCIKGVNRKILQIGIPNLEVKRAYSEIMLRLLTNNNDVQEKFTTSL